MNFCSILFLFIFIPIFMLLYFLLPKKYNNLILIISSIIFYSLGDISSLLLILTLIFINYFGCKVINKFNRNIKRKKIYFISLIIINILSLILLKSFNIKVIGYTIILLRMLSYIIDIYKRKYNNEKNIIYYMLYILMFPCLIYGPIMDYEDIRKQLIKRETNLNNFINGFIRFIKGLFKNTIIVSNLYLLFNTIVNINNNESSVLLCYLGLISLILGVCIELSGYNDMAMGLGLILGFKYKENYDYPFSSLSFKEFLRKLNVTLYDWFKNNIIFKIIIIIFVSILFKNTNMFFILSIYMLIGLILDKYLIKIPIYLKRIYSIILGTFFLLILVINNLSIFYTYIKTLFFINKNDFINNSFIYYFSNYFIIILIGIIINLPIKIKYNNKLISILRIIIYVLLFIISISYIITNNYNSFINILF